MALSWDDYRKQVADSVRDYLDDDNNDLSIDEDEGTIDRDELYDDMWIADDVTGNGSGSYTFNAHEAAENVAEVIWTDEFDEMCGEYSTSLAKLGGPEAADVSIRCWLLGEVMDDVLDDWADEHDLRVI